MPVVVSIISPLYNKAQFVSAMIASVNRQTFKEWELIIVDNMSTDGSPDVVRPLLAPNIRLLSCTTQGPGPARNEGLAAATGEWILFLDSDDLIEANYLERRLAVVAGADDVDIVVGSYSTFFDTDPTSLEVVDPVGKGLPPSAAVDAAFAFPPWAVHSALLRRTSLYSACWWPTDIGPNANEDVVFWFRVLHGGARVRYTNGSGALYRAGTPNSRDRRESLVVGWGEAVSANVAFLAAQGASPSPAQCENVLRGYSRLHIEAMGSNDEHLQELTLQEAERWLAVRVAHSAPLPMSIGVRRLVGIRAVCRLSAALTRLKRAVASFRDVSPGGTVTGESSGH